jgi:hypothetical protein
MSWVKDGVLVVKDEISEEMSPYFLFIWESKYFILS